MKRHNPQEQKKNRKEDSIDSILKAGNQMVKWVIYSTDLTRLNLITIVRKKNNLHCPQKGSGVDSSFESGNEDKAKNRGIG